MSRRVSVGIDISDESILEKTLDESDCSWRKSSENKIEVDSFDGKSAGPYFTINLEEGQIEYDEDYRRCREFAKVLRRDYSKNKVVDNALRGGHSVQREWVSDGNETITDLQGAKKGDVIVEASY